MKIKGKQELKYAFPKTVPVMVGYLFLGMAYGILMKVNGYGVWWSFGLSLLVYAGSLQYLGITLLASAVHPLYAFLMGLMLNARHLFYGISMLGKYGSVKKYKPYLIFSLTDETFSVLCHEQAPEGIDREKVYFWVSVLDHFYWVLGGVLGAVIGSMITFNTTGLDFALTALFVVIFTDQWKSSKDHNPAILGVAASVVSLVIFGADQFIIPAMILILGALAAGYGRGAGNIAAKKEESEKEISGDEKDSGKVVVENEKTGKRIAEKVKSEKTIPGKKEEPTCENS